MWDLKPHCLALSCHRITDELNALKNISIGSNNAFAYNRTQKYVISEYLPLAFVYIQVCHLTIAWVCFGLVCLLVFVFCLFVLWKMSYSHCLRLKIQQPGHSRRKKISGLSERINN